MSRNKPARRRRFWSPGIRLKTLLVSAVLLAIPWLGYQYILAMEDFLRQGQEQTLMGTARAVATALHERPQLFNHQSAFLNAVREGRDLYARALPHAIQLDGRTDDWNDALDSAHRYGETNLLESRDPFRAPTLGFRHLLGKYGAHLYALFIVDDDKIVFREAQGTRLERGDHLQIALLDASGIFRRYLLTAYAPGWVNAHEITANPDSALALRPEVRIQGVWHNSASGYVLELRMPLSMIGTKIGFAVADVDDPYHRRLEAVIGTSGTQSLDELGTVLMPSPEIEQIIKGLGRTESRIWVLDRHRRVLAQAGDIRRNVEHSNKHSQTPLDQLHELWRTLLYRWLLKHPTEEFTDALSGAARLDGPEIEAALDGRPSSGWRATPDERAVIAAAAYPIWIDDQVMGTVVVEESTNAILTLRNRAMERLLLITLAAFLIGALTLFIFASRIAARIRRLRDDAERAIDAQGRLHGTPPALLGGKASGDELGDLSRSFSDTLRRLSQYTDYLENMARRLSHELRTPIAVVRSSLDNLSQEPLDASDRIYMERARSGIDRLNSLVTRMSEAARLEETLQRVEREPFNLSQVLRGCVEGYRGVYPNAHMELDLPTPDVQLHGAPELIVQLLDKLIANAVDFHSAGTPIQLALQCDNDKCTLRIANQGPALPADMTDRLFESMVTVRTADAGSESEPHLGLGLYIVRMIAEFHGGSVMARNRAGGDGVEVVVELPVGGGG